MNKCAVWLAAIIISWGAVAVIVYLFVYALNKLLSPD